MKKYFVTGLVILLPLVLTIAVLNFVLNLLTAPFMGLISNFLSHLESLDHHIFYLSSKKLIKLISQFLILSLIFFLTVGLGALTRWIFVNSLMEHAHKIVLKIPIVNSIYKTTKDIVNTLFASDKNSFKQVVMVPFPDKNVYVLGFIAREAPSMCCDKIKQEMVTVFIPTTPNPTTGFLLMYRKEDLHYLDMKSDEALKYIVSCGVIVPAGKTH